MAPTRLQLALAAAAVILCTPQEVMAQERKETTGEQTEWMKKAFALHVKSLSLQKGSAHFVTDGFFQKAGKSDFLLSKGETFEGQQDHHASSTFTCTGVHEKDGVGIQYQSSFDHRSFGKNLVSTDKGSLQLPWKK